MTGRRRNVAADLATWRRVHFFVQMQRNMKGKPHAKGDGPIERAAKKFHTSTRQIERVLAKFTPETAVYTAVSLSMQAAVTGIAAMWQESFTQLDGALLSVSGTVRQVMDDYATIKRNLTKTELTQIVDVDDSTAFAFALSIAKARESAAGRTARHKKRKVNDNK
jgi:hypothetical protein